uniref:Carbohydrate sulfotransferase n=2 Tax=Nothobranchius kuhntae TaxID=321403 RepID=A0A1A8HLV2_NOTKU
MGAWRGLRVAFILGSLFMILLIIVYWDGVGGFNLYLFPDVKHNSLQSGCSRRMTTSTVSTVQSHASSPITAHTATSSSPIEAAQILTDEEQMKEESEDERIRFPAEDMEQEARKQRIMDVCSGKPYTDPEAVPPDLVHNSSLHLTFAKFWRHYGSLSRHLMALKLQRYTKFLFVRDPFVRLISAFRNKFERPNEDFYRQFGSVMLRRYGNVSEDLAETAAEAFAAGIKPTFHQFISYLLDPETERKSIFNEHWRQVYRLCHPCQVKYDFIGRLETLETDSKHLLKLLKVDHFLRFPSGARNRTETSWERDWFAQIPLTKRRELYDLYKPDFELFGYPRPDGVLHR